MPFLNTLPFAYGIKKTFEYDEIEIFSDIPSVSADNLVKDRIDIGIVPVAIIPKLKEHHIYTNYCIGGVGNVRTVELYSQVPLKEIKHVLLDYKSRSSVNLVRVLAKNFWHISPEWVETKSDFLDEISGTTAGVIIGDRNFEIKSKFEFVYDLSEEWQKFKSLPFVFACWIANKELPAEFIAKFNKAVEYGVNHKEEAIVEWYSQNENPNNIDLHEYLNKYISYNLDDLKKQGMTEFLKLLM